MLSILPAIAAMAPPAPLADGGTVLYGPEYLAGRSDTNLVPEASGLIASRRFPGVYWTHNDSDAAHPRVHVFRLNAEDRRTGKVPYLGYVELIGAGPGDWEDIAAGPDHTIYILDGGDNPPCTRKNKRIYRFAEPSLPPNGTLAAARVPCESIRFEYPDPRDPRAPATRDEDRFDAEALFVHPATSDMYIVTKRDHRNKPVARVYMLAPVRTTWNTDRLSVLRFVADLSDRVPHMVTAGDLSADGRHMLLRNYWAMYQFTLPPEQPFENIFQQRPLTHPLLLEAAQLLQGEGICWTHDARDILTVTEAPRSAADRAFRVFVVPWLLANVEVQHIGPTSLTISWRTVEPWPSRVEYQSGNDRVLEVRDDTETTHHRLVLSNLEPNAHYRYRIHSGAIRWPVLGPWAEFVTTTSAHTATNPTTNLP